MVPTYKVILMACYLIYQATIKLLQTSPTFPFNDLQLIIKFLSTIKNNFQKNSLQEHRVSILTSAAVFS